jgi:hypothetical protein
MSPTCSKRFLAGRKARSAALRTICVLPQDDSPPTARLVTLVEKAADPGFK